MKKFLPFLFVLIGFTSSAQLVNIPDVNFKAALVHPFCEDMGFGANIDTNQDGEVQVSEAAAVTELTIRPCFPIFDLTGIEAFVNLKKLHYMNSGGLTSLNLTSLTNLEEFDFGSLGNSSGNGSITAMNFTNLTNLKTLIVSNSNTSTPHITDLNISGCNNLRRLECSGNSFTSFSLPNLLSLDTLVCNNNLLLTNLDLHGCSNLKYLRFLNCPALMTLNLKDCAMVPYVHLDPGVLTTLDVSGCTAMDQIYFKNNHVNNFNFTGANNVANIECSGNNLTSLDASGITSITGLYCINNPNLTSLNVSGCSNLIELICNNMQLNTLLINGCSSLQRLDCRYNQLTSLDLTGDNALKQLICQNNLLTGTLDLSDKNKLEFALCSHNQFDSVSAQNCTKLYQLDMDYNKVHGINTNGCDTLEMLTAYTNLLTSIDLSNAPRLRYLNANYNPGLTYVNVKNGWIDNTTLYVAANTNLQYVCADDDEVLSIINFFANIGVTNISVNSYCDFVPGGQYNTIHGTVKLDLDNNGCDVNDNTLNELRVKVEQGTNAAYTTVDATGNYILYTYAGSYTVTPQFQHPYFTVSPATVNFPASNGSVQDINFCITKTGIHPDLEITLIPITRARPGFNSDYKLVYKNKGTETLSGNMNLNFDDAKMNFLSATPAQTTQNSGVLAWAYSNLLPFESRTIDIHFNLLAPPVNNIDDTLTFTSNITPLAGDGTPFDNSFALEQVVTGSFDPNDKSCLEGSRIDIIRVGDYVHYMVRFQNTGNEVAENVVVKDMLETNFDWNSFELVKTSHPCVLKQTDGNKLEFIFQGINLPAVTVDEPGSHGFIAFKVKSISTLVIGDSLKNNAAIYFDFNLPVITNTAASRIDSIHLVPITIEYFKGSSQGGNHLLNWKASCTSSQAIFNIERSTDARNYTSLNSITASDTRCLQPFDYTDNNPAAGINYYRIKMTDVNGKVSYSSVIALLNKKTGFEIVNLLPNPVINGTASLNITSAEKQPVKIIVSDASGKIVQSINQSVISGFTPINMNFAKLASGTYTIVVYTNDGEKKTKQFIKQ